MSTAIFKITDGTNSVDLLELREGVGAEGWLQAVATYKGGGTFQQSSLSDGRRLVDKPFDAIQEIIPLLTIKGSAQDVTIAILHKLFALMELASDYWASDWCDTPVWLESRAECETNTRYALVVTANIPNLAEIYAPGAFANPDYPLAEMQLIIEHEHWTENAPGTGTAVEIFNQETYDGRTLGRTATTADEVYVSSRGNQSNLTDIYTWSAANGWSANLMNAALPYALIDTVGAAPAVNDLVYFGVDTNPEFGGNFHSLIFDIGTPQAGLSLTWEYWTGAAWAAFAAPLTVLQDNTDTGGQPLDTTGVNSVLFTSSFARTIINGITAWWIRLRVTAVGVVTAPTQQNRDVYTVSWPYIELDSDQILGNIDALAMLKLVGQTDFTGTDPSTDFVAIRRVVVGLRSQERGSDFRAYLNLSDEQQPANVVAAVTGATIGFTGLDYPSTGRAIATSVAGAAAMTSMCTITISAPLTVEYYGQFKAFLRIVRQTGAGTPVTIQVVTTVSSGGSSVTSPQTVTASTQFQVVGLGTISIPLSPLRQSDMIDQIVFDIQLESTAASDNIFFVDLILIPTDEWACDVFDHVLSTTSPVETNERLLIDSIAYPKSPLRTNVVDVSTGYIKTVWGAIKNGPAILHRAANQRMWFAIFDVDTSTDTMRWDTKHLLSIQIERQQRYLGPRGNQ